MHSKLFESALGVGEPWFVKDVNFDVAAKQLTIGIDLLPAAAFPFRTWLGFIRCTIPSSSATGI